MSSSQKTKLHTQQRSPFSAAFLSNFSTYLSRRVVRLVRRWDVFPTITWNWHNVVGLILGLLNIGLERVFVDDGLVASRIVHLVLKVGALAITKALMLTVSLEHLANSIAKNPRAHAVGAFPQRRSPRRVKRLLLGPPLRRLCRPFRLECLGRLPVATVQPCASSVSPTPAEVFPLTRPSCVLGTVSWLSSGPGPRGNVHEPSDFGPVVDRQLAGCVEGHGGGGGRRSTWQPRRTAASEPRRWRTT